MQNLDQTIYSALLLIFSVFMILRLKSRKIIAIKGMSTVIIFSCGCLFVKMPNDYASLYTLICLMWLPLSLEDILYHRVNTYYLVIVTIFCVALSQVFNTTSLLELTTIFGIIFAIKLAIGVIERVKKTTLIGQADYYAALAFISIIGPSSVGTWFILFPIMGIAGHLLRSNRPLEIPLIPYMFSAWCLVYTIQHSYIFLL